MSDDLLTVPLPSLEDLQRDAAADYSRAIRVEDEVGNKEPIVEHWRRFSREATPAWIRRTEALRAENAELIRLSRKVIDAESDEDCNLAIRDLREQVKGCGWTDMPEPVALRLVERAEKAEAELARIKDILTNHDHEMTAEAAQEACKQTAKSQGPKYGSLWRHFASKHVYMVVTTAVLEGILEPCVVYRSLDKGTFWVRLLSNWQDVIESPDGPVPRFAKIKDGDGEVDTSMVMKLLIGVAERAAKGQRAVEEELAKVKAENVELRTALEKERSK